MTNEEMLQKLARKRTALAERAITSDMKQTLDAISIDITMAKIYVDRGDDRISSQLTWLDGALSIFEHWVDSVSPKTEQSNR